MTTIAYDGESLCTDSLITSGSMVFGTTEKIQKLDDGRIMACAGSADIWPVVKAWLNGGDKPVLDDSDEFQAIVVSPDGTAYELSKQMRLFPACVPWACGSGESFAMAAMKLGKTAKEAIELACKMDIYSGLPIQQVKL